MMLGAFEPKAKPWGMEGIREDFCFDTLPEDFDHFQPILEAAMNRMPLFQTAGIHTFFNGPESFTPDDRYYLGAAPELAGYWIAAGYNSVGIVSSGGAGMALAHWITEGEAPFDLWEVDIRRAQPFQKNRRYLKERVTRDAGAALRRPFPLPAGGDRAGRAAVAAARASEGARRGVRRGGGLGAGELVRAAGAGAGVPLFLGAAELVRQPEGRASGGAERGRAVRHDLVRQDPGRGAGCLRASCNRLCSAEMDVAAGRIVYTDAERARRDRERPDGDAAVGDRLPAGGAGGDACSATWPGCGRMWARISP